jgi:hypothetical protein
MIKVGSKVSVFPNHDGRGTVLAINVTEVPVPNSAQMYKFDEPRYAVLLNNGKVVYPKMDNEVKEIQE